MFRSRRIEIDNIEPGKQFRAIGGGTWEYAGKASTKGPGAHVRLVRPNDRRTIKIISVDALTDPTLFEPVE